MSHFAALLTRSGSDWTVEEVGLDGCESVADIGELLRDAVGDVRLVAVEQDDEYAALVRLDDDADDPRAFLTDAHAADSYPVAAYLAEDLEKVRPEPASEDGADGPDTQGSESDEALAAGTAVVHESAPLGDADIVGDLGTGAVELLALCAHEGTLPMDLLVAVCEKAGCGPAFDDLRG